MCLLWPLCVHLGGALGGCLFLFLLFHPQYLLLFPVLQKSIPLICSIPFEAYLEQRSLFCLYLSLVEISLGYRQSSRCRLAIPVVVRSHVLSQIWVNTMGLCSLMILPFLYNSWEHIAYLVHRFLLGKPGCDIVNLWFFNSICLDNKSDISDLSKRENLVRNCRHREYFQICWDLVADRLPFNNFNEAIFHFF